MNNSDQWQNDMTLQLSDREARAICEILMKALSNSEYAPDLDRGAPGAVERLMEQGKQGKPSINWIISCLLAYQLLSILVIFAQEGKKQIFADIDIYPWTQYLARRVLEIDDCTLIRQTYPGFFTELTGQIDPLRGSGFLINSC